MPLKETRKMATTNKIIPLKFHNIVPLCFMIVFMFKADEFVLSWLINNFYQLYCETVIIFSIFTCMPININI